VSAELGADRHIWETRLAALEEDLQAEPAEIEGAATSAMVVAARRAENRPLAACSGALLGGAKRPERDRVPLLLCRRNGVLPLPANLVTEDVCAAWLHDSLPRF
jgi:hypothetical protein